MVVGGVGMWGGGYVAGGGGVDRYVGRGGKVGTGGGGIGTLGLGEG